MRQAYAPEAIPALDLGSRRESPRGCRHAGVVPTLAHEPPCPLSRTTSTSQRVEDELHIRVLFATEPENDPEVR